MRELNIPGLSTAVIDAGKVAWARGYGLSDTVEKTAVNPQTLFQAGSISKPIAALGALRLIVEGTLAKATFSLVESGGKVTALRSSAGREFKRSE